LFCVTKPFHVARGIPPDAATRRRRAGSKLSTTTTTNYNTTTTTTSNTMANLPEGVTVHLDEAFTEDTDSVTESSDDGSVPRDKHQERFGKYVPPHLRGHNMEGGDQFVNFRDRAPSRGPDPDRVEGADNDKYQRLKQNIPFAIGFDLIRKVLRPQFPGVFFHCNGNVNHDHPISHVVTMLGTRFLQRKIHPGARVMDVYGNPYACERFNRSQAPCAQPKLSTALVHNYGPNDFIREVNKWGPVQGEGGPRYIEKTISQALRDGDCDEFDTFQFIHTLYYTNFSLVKRLLQTKSAAGKKKRALALVHRHVGQSGSINNGEQTFETKEHPAFEAGLLKQKNVKTNSVYVHPNLTPVLFKEVKEWFPSQHAPLEMRDKGAVGDDGVGLAWECHMVNEDTWIIEFVLCDNRHYTADEPSFAEMWDDDKTLEEDYLSTPTESSDVSARTWENRLEWLPAIGQDRDFTHLELVSKPLFEKLRLSAAGRPRSDKKVFADLMKEAKHLTAPSALFGDKDGMRCPPERIVDHVTAAILVDYEKEDKLLQGMIALKPLLRKHAEDLKFGSTYRDLSFGNLIDVIRSSLAVARTVNTVVKHRDPIDAGIGAMDNWLAPPA
jgi:hypothetical protein